MNASHTSASCWIFGSVNKSGAAPAPHEICVSPMAFRWVSALRHRYKGNKYHGMPGSYLAHFHYLRQARFLAMAQATWLFRGSRFQQHQASPSSFANRAPAHVRAKRAVLSAPCLAITAGDNARPFRVRRRGHQGPVFIMSKPIDIITGIIAGW